MGGGFSTSCGYEGSCIRKNTRGKGPKNKRKAKRAAKYRAEIRRKLMKERTLEQQRKSFESDYSEYMNME